MTLRCETCGSSNISLWYSSACIGAYCSLRCQIIGTAEINFIIAGIMLFLGIFAAANTGYNPLTFMFFLIFAFLAIIFVILGFIGLKLRKSVRKRVSKKDLEEKLFLQSLEEKRKIPKF